MIFLLINLVKSGFIALLDPKRHLCDRSQEFSAQNSLYKSILGFKQNQPIWNF